MTKFGKTIFGKILKGAAIAGGSVLALSTGIGAIGGIASGAGALSGIIKSTSGVKKVIDKVGASAVNLVTGTTKQEREQVREVKAETKAAMDKIEQVNRLVKAGASVAQARATVGLGSEELPTYEKETVQTASLGEFFTANKKMIMIAGGVIAALFVLPKLLKRK